ncbi:MAG TPA: TetR/AcrR family transcriptional regulator [Xanthobacteraceae bacterium]|jgi:AcrR family transcriptional regulator|nr:TetR/AcrR family transcriptional regulator [Xanthobacteraceae bacterium]
MNAEPARRLPSADEENAKRRQILEGARRVFLTRGFDAASMGEIARAAGVSKGTLYVYFENKEQLFEAIVHEECADQAEQVFQFDPAEHDVAAVLTRLGVAFVNFICRPEKGSSLRTVIAIADRMPEIGRRFYETGPAVGIGRLADYLRAQVDAGVLRVEDCEVAAAQFVDACQSTLFKPMIFNFGTPPTPERIAHVVGVAVRTFMAAYAAR